MIIISLEHNIAVIMYIINIKVKIILIRKKKKITPAQLARMSNINQGNISKIEKGKINISINMLLKIVECMGGSLDITIKEYDEQMLH